jgi:outer membrane protein OmpU
MKKQLLGSTALVAAGMLAAAGSADAQQPTPGKISLQLGGYMTQYFGWSQNSNEVNFPLNAGGNNAPGWQNWNQQSDAEFYLLGKTTLDNGITVGVNIELEIVGSPGQTTDEQWAFVEGAFGQVRLGMEDPPVFLMHYAAPDAGLGLSYGWASYSFVPNPQTTNAPSNRLGASTVHTADNTRGIVGGYDNPINTTRQRLEDDDSNKIVYYTPRIEGFQFGVSYAPTAIQDAVAGTPEPGGRSAAYTDGWSLGLNFVRKFDPIDIALSAGYARWDHNAQIVKDLHPEAASPWTFALGTNIGFAGFTFGASYAEVKDLRYSQTGAAIMNGGKSWDIGLQYDFGATSVSIGYFEGWVDGAVGAAGPAGIPTYGHDKHTMYQVSAGHRFGPGVAIKGSAFLVDWIEEGTGRTAQNGSGGLIAPFDNRGFGVAAGLFLNF